MNRFGHIKYSKFIFIIILLICIPLLSQTEAQKKKLLEKCKKEKGYYSHALKIKKAATPLQEPPLFMLRSSVC